MLIHTLPEKPSVSGKLYIRRQLRAPLGLASGSTIWMVHHPRGPKHYSDLLISPFAPESWADMWRLEIQFSDKIGQMARLIDLLDSRNVFVLHETSRQALRHEYHVKYLMLDCTRYVSDIDGSTEERRNESGSLKGLETEILINFLDLVRLTAEGNPRLRLERNYVHLNLHQGVTRTRTNNNASAWRDFWDPVRTTVDNKQIDIRPALVDPTILDKKETYFICTCNAKAMMLYCAIANSEVTTAHLVIHFDASKQGLLATVLHSLSDQDFNIVRSQLREGIVGRYSGTSEKFIKVAQRPFTLNLFVEIHTPQAHVDINYLNSFVFPEFIENNLLHIVQYKPVVPPLITADR